MEPQHKNAYVTGFGLIRAKLLVDDEQVHALLGAVDPTDRRLVLALITTATGLLKQVAEKESLAESWSRRVLLDELEELEDLDLKMLDKAGTRTEILNIGSGPEGTGGGVGTH